MVEGMCMWHLNLLSLHVYSKIQSITFLSCFLLNLQSYVKTTFPGDSSSRFFLVACPRKTGTSGHPTIMFGLEGRNNAVRDKTNVQQLYFTVHLFLQLVHVTPQTPYTPSSVGTALSSSHQKHRTQL